MAGNFTEVQLNSIQRCLGGAIAYVEPDVAVEKSEGPSEGSSLPMEMAGAAPNPAPASPPGAALSLVRSF